VAGFSFASRIREIRVSKDSYFRIYLPKSKNSSP
jgi:hypothetical protein